MFRPRMIQPLPGARSKARLYRARYIAAAPLLRLVRALRPQQVLTIEDIGIAMFDAVRHGAPKPVLESPDIHALCEGLRHA